MNIVYSTRGGMPGGGVPDRQCFDDHAGLSAGDAGTADSYFLRLTETDDTDGICLSSVGHRDLLSHFFCSPGAVACAISARSRSAIQNISEGDLNTAIEVRGDDEFTAMAVQFK